MNARRIAAGLGLIALLYWASGWLFPKEDDRSFLLALPGRVATLVEQGKTGDAMAFVSREYSDAGGRTHADIHRMIAAQVLAGGPITIYTLGPRVEIEGSRATLVFRAAMARGPRDPKSVLDVIPQSASIWDFSLELDKGSGSWLVVSGSWTQG